MLDLPLNQRLSVLSRLGSPPAEVGNEMAEEGYNEALELEGAEQDAGVDDMEATAELEAMKARLQEMEKEAAKLKEMQDKVQKESGMTPAGSGSLEAGGPGSKEEVDGRSVYVGNVDYGCTPEELQMHFQNCGTVNRVTILTDKGGNPKGFAYIEFLEADAVAAACLMEGSELRGRQIKVSPKRTNVPGMKQRGRGRGRGRGPPGYFPMMPMMPPPFMFGYGYAPRGRGRGRGGGYYSPY